MPSVRTKRHTHVRRSLSLKTVCQFCGRRIPNRYGGPSRLSTHHGQTATIGAVGHSHPEGGRGHVQGFEFLAAAGVPHLDCAVRGSGNEAPDGATKPGPCAINCTNNREPFSFHPAGINVVFADGSVRFLQEDMDIRVFARLATRAGEEVVAIP